MNDDHTHPPQSTHRRLLTPDELASLFHVSKATVYRLVEARRIAFHRIAGCLRFTQKDVDEYMNNSRVVSITKQTYGNT